jgi:phosphate-selective porin OprO/OprP
MKKSTILSVICILLIAISNISAQDSKIPGGDYSAPIGAEVRNGKLVFESQDGNFRWWIDSRIQLDGAMYFENKNQLSNGTYLRRLTFAVKSQLWKDWEAELDLDFAEAVLDLRDMFIKYKVPDVNLSFQAGNFKEPFGMERLNSSRLLSFLERSAMSNAFPMGRRIGFAARYWEDYGQITVGVFGHEAGTRIDKGTRDEGFSTNVRVSVAPINKHGENLHIGLAGSYKVPDAVADLNPNTIEVKARTETYVFDPKLLHTGDIKDVNYFNRFGGELMGIYGPFYLQSEVQGMQVKRWYGKPNVNLYGGYIMAAYVLTGETRYYFADEGEVGPIEKPKCNWGALEIAARYSVLDLNDPEAAIFGGQSNQLMLGLNYYPNSSIKFQINYSTVNLDQFATSKGKFVGDDDFSFMQFRIQASL